MHKTTSHPNTPSPTLLDKIGATNLTLAEAVAEIVANSFDAAVEGTPSTVEISISPESVSVADHGVGMTEAVLVQALKLGTVMSKHVKRKASAKGHFGLGLKTACASIGKWWSIRTRPMGQDVEYSVEFDLAKWEQKEEDERTWTIEVEQWSPPPAGSPLGARPHGTVVEVRRLRGKTPMAGAVTEKMGEAFKPHLSAGDSISVNGIPATPHNHHFVANSKLPIDLTFGPNDKYHITGWVAIDRRTHNDGDYGFNIYRSGQLIQTWCQDWIPAHLMTSRIIGEVHMDFIDATFFKQGLQQSDLWRLASAEMREFLKPIVKASRDLSRKGNINKPGQAQEIVQDMYAGLGLDQPKVWEEATGDGVDGSDGEDAQRPELPRIRVETQLLQLEGNLSVSLSSVEREIPGGGTPFDFMWDGTTLLTVINLAHPLVANTKDRDQLRLLASADSILRFLISERGLTPLRAAEVRGSWILASLEVPQPTGTIA